MAEQLTVVNQGALAIAGGETKVGDLLKPLVTEVHLFDTHIAGTSFLKDKAPIDEAETGQKLILRRENNKYDDKAILILDEKGRKMGYVPEKDNIIFSRLMDAGKMLAGKIDVIEKKGTFTRIKIGIFLVDF